MSLQSWFFNRNKFFYIILFGLFFIGTAYFNKGFVASDEYWIGITRYIPAQNSHLNTLVKEDDVKSPVQILPFYLTAKWALNMGIEEPYKQYSFVVLVMGIYAALIYGVGILIYFRRRCLFSNLTFEEESSSRLRNLTFLMFTFYFASPFILTRPMFESVSAPFLFLSAIFALMYDSEVKITDLLWSLFFFSLAFLLRPQVCLTALTLLILPILKRRWKDLLTIGMAGLVALVLTGIPDLILIGKFHGSLIKLAGYNMVHGEEYGNQPFYYFPVLILALTLAPFFIKKYRSGFFLNHLVNQKVLVFYVVFFVVFHSLFPHKFERFIIPILPLLILFMAPLLENLIESKQSLNLSFNLRWAALLILNFTLFCIVTFFPAQKNITDLTLYINEHKNLTRVFFIDNSITWIPEAFLSRKSPELIFFEANKNESHSFSSDISCESVIVTPIDFKQTKAFPSKFQLLATFNVNAIEKLAYYFNPQNNKRRVSLQLWGCE
jgi:hypothetical protein